MNITANQTVVSEAGGHRLGGALDWGAGSGSVSGTSIGPGAKVEDKAVARFQIGALPGRKGSLYANEPYKVYRNGALHHQGLTDEQGMVTVPHPDGTSHYKVELVTGQRFEMPVQADFMAGDHAAIERESRSIWGHQSLDGLEHEAGAGRALFDFL